MSHKTQSGNFILNKLVKETLEVNYNKPHTAIGFINKIFLGLSLVILAYVLMVLIQEMFFLNLSDLQFFFFSLTAVFLIIMIVVFIIILIIVARKALKHCLTLLLLCSFLEGVLFSLLAFIINRFAPNLVHIIFITSIIEATVLLFLYKSNFPIIYAKIKSPKFLPVIVVGLFLIVYSLFFIAGLDTYIVILFYVLTAFIIATVITAQLRLVLQDVDRIIEERISKEYEWATALGFLIEYPIAFFKFILLIFTPYGY